jgi:hypothetical protein
MVFSSANSLFLGAKSPFFSHLSRWIIAFLKKGGISPPISEISRRRNEKGLSLFCRDSQMQKFLFN